MNFLNLLNEALEGKKDLDKVKKNVIDIPALEKNKRIENLKDGREARFKKVPDEHLFLDPSDGFFFRYNPKDDGYYFESNASMSFIVDVNPKRHRGTSKWDTVKHAYDLKRIGHPEFGHNDDLNFRVDKRTHKIFQEKKWGGEHGNKIISARITDPEEVKDALKIAINHHPELERYTFVPNKSTVKEYIEGAGGAALEKGESIKVYFAGTGTRIKEILKDGIPKEYVDQYEKRPVLYLDKKEAKSEAKNRVDKESLFNVWGIVEIQIRSQDQIGEKRFDGYLAGSADIPAKDVKLVSSSLPKFFEPSFTEPKVIKELEGIPLTKSHQFENIFVARDDAEWDYFINSREPEKRSKSARRAPKPNYTYFSNQSFVKLWMPNYKTVTMFKPGTSLEEIKSLLAKEWLRNKSFLTYEIHWNDKNTILSSNWPTEIYFNYKYPEIMMHKMIEAAFKADSDWLARILKHMIPPWDKAND